MTPKLVCLAAPFGAASFSQIFSGMAIALLWLALRLLLLMVGTASNIVYAHMPGHTFSHSKIEVYSHGFYRHFYGYGS